ncbi:MAG: glycosyltransferase [Candidatus Binatia bacterium]
MKLLFCALHHDYGCVHRGPSFELINLGDALRRMADIEVVDFPYDVLRHRGCDVNEELIRTVEKERPDVTLIVLFKDDFEPRALDRARGLTTLVSWGCDDHVEFNSGYMQRYAAHFDYSITTCKQAVPKYFAAGQPNIIVSQWGCNHHLYHPSDKGSLYDVSFVGLNYGSRMELVNQLWSCGIRVAVFGHNWPLRRRQWRRGLRFTLFGRGWVRPRWVEPDEMVEIYSRTKINLCINNNVTAVENIKGRNFEVPGCRGFLLSGPAQNLEEYFEIGKEVIVYNHRNDLAKKIDYYLQHDKERETIAQAGYERVLRDHTYEKRFEQIFSIIRQGHVKRSSPGLFTGESEQGLSKPESQRDESGDGRNAEMATCRSQLIQTPSQPFISIVVPCYNQSHFLHDCLQSVAEQSFRNWEAIVVDDASTESDPADVVRQFGHEQVKLVHHNRNQGLGAARNTGFKLARGELVVPLDADDRLSSTFLQRLSLALQGRPDADCVFPDFQLFGTSNEVWHHQVCDAAAMTQRQWIPGPGTLMRRSLWDRVGGYCESIEILGNEDWDFWLSAVSLGIRAVHVPEALYLYRRHKTSMAVRLRYEDFQHRKFLYRRHRTLFERYKTGNEFLAEGYVNSAVASWQRRKRIRAVYLGGRAYWLSPRRTHLLKLVASTWIPSFLIPAARKGRELLREIHSLKQDRVS